MEELNVDPRIRAACMPASGIVIVSGPTGSGKTTLIDSMLHGQAVHPEGKHIIVMGAPVENDLNNIEGRTGIIAQSNVGAGFGSDLPSFARSVRNVLRRHPDVVYFTEARDKETILGAAHVAQTGHTCYTTTHTASVHMTIPRMGDEFSGGERVRVIKNLIENSRLIVHQRLYPRPSGVGRAPVVSFLPMMQEIRTRLLQVPVDELPLEMYNMTNKYGQGLLEHAQQQYQKGQIGEGSLVSLREELEAEIGTL